ncbi:hypothetical protein [Lactococcus lactis]
MITLILDSLKSFAFSKKFTFLEEKKVPRTKGEETYFIMSPIAAHIKIFDEAMKNNRKSSETFFTKQMSFYSNKLDGVGENPLTNPMEMGFSLFFLNQNNPEYCVRQSIEFLKFLGLKKENLYFRVDGGSEFNKIFGTDEELKNENIFQWDSLEKFHLGNQRPQGFYAYPYYRHLNGIVPIGSIAYIKLKDKYYFDVLFFIERLALILENKYSMCDLEEVHPMKTIISKRSFIINSERFLLLFRAILILIKDGLYEVAYSGSGFYFKKLCREIAFLLDGNEIDRLFSLELLEVFENQMLHYGYEIDFQEFERKFEVTLNYINKASRIIYRVMSKELSKATIETMKETEDKLKSLGIHLHWIALKKSKYPNIKDVVIEIVHRKSLRSISLGGNEQDFVNIKKLLSERK